MLLLLSLLLCLPALSSVVSSIATPSESKIGKVPGYLTSWNGSPPNTGDYLAATFCYCSLDAGHVPNRIEEAHYFQYEYYNKHSNTTYILNDQCTSTSDGNHPGCLHNVNLDHPKHAERLCKTWRKDPNNGSGGHDTFCYAAVDVDSKGEDEVWFNRDRRELGPKGHQAPFSQPADMVVKACTSLCSEFDAGLHVLPESRRLAPNRVIVWADFDDMCDHCK